MYDTVGIWLENNGNEEMQFLDTYESTNMRDW